MGKNQSPLQENKASDPAQDPESNVTEPKSSLQSFETESHTKNSRKKILIVVVLILLLAGAGAATYITTQQEDSVSVDTSNSVEETYKSTLYPDLTFVVPSGWEVSEPEEYLEDSKAKGSADGTITVSNYEVALKLDLITAQEAVFEDYTCYSRAGLTAVGDVYRFLDSDGTFYANGISETNDEWAQVIADEGNSTYFEDPNPNYCYQFPFIGTYTSKLNQSDYPEQPYGFTDQEKAIVWLSAYLAGTPTVAQQADADAIIKSLSQPDLGI